MIEKFQPETAEYFENSNRNGSKMSDLISRKALRLMKVEECAGHSIEYAEGWKACIEWIKTLPSAEPERKKGQWSNYKDEHCCSVCKCVVISDCWDDEIRYDYCPYCGADMSEGE